MKLCQKIKIDVSKQDAATLEFMQGKCRGLYNWWVMRLRNGERWNVNVAKKSLRESKAYDPDLRSVYGKLLAEVYFRLDGAMQAFFRRLAAGEKKPGFPRFKPRHEFFTLCYPAMYLDKIEGNTIILPTGGGGSWGLKRYPNITAHLTETPPEHFREVAVSRDARGNYYCSFVYDDAERQIEQDSKKHTHKKRNKRKERPMRNDGIVAFDLGIKTLATGVTDQGRFYHIGGFKGYRWYNRQLDKIRSKRDRCKKKSRRYIHLSKVYKRVAERKRRKQRDCLLTHPTFQDGYEWGYLQGNPEEEEWTVPKLVNELYQNLAELYGKHEPDFSPWTPGFLLGELASIAEQDRTLALTGLAHYGFLFPLITQKRPADWPRYTLYHAAYLHRRAVKAYRVRVRSYREQGQSFDEAQRLALC